MPLDGQATACFRPIQREGADNGEAARPQSMGENLDIGALRLGFVQKMQRGAIMPEIIGFGRGKTRHVGLNPRD